MVRVVMRNRNATLCGFIAVFGIVVGCAAFAATAWTFSEWLDWYSTLRHVAMRVESISRAGPTFDTRLSLANDGDVAVLVRHMLLLLHYEEQLIATDNLENINLELVPGKLETIEVSLVSNLVSTNIPDPDADDAGWSLTVYLRLHHRGHADGFRLKREAELKH